MKWQTKHSKLPAKDFETCDFHQDMWYPYIMLGYVLAHIPWNAILNCEPQWSNIATQCDLLLPSTTTRIIIAWKEYLLPKDAIQKQLPSRETVSLALDGWS